MEERSLPRIRLLLLWEWPVFSLYSKLDGIVADRVVRHIQAGRPGDVAVVCLELGSPDGVCGALAFFAWLGALKIRSFARASVWRI